MKKTLLTPIALLFTSLIFCQTFEVYISDAGDFYNPPFQVLKFDNNGENPDTFATEQLAWPQDILFLEDQNIALISSLSNNKIVKYDIEQEEYIEDFATVAGGPTRMKIGADNLLYVLQWGGNGRVLRYELDGTFVDEFTSLGVSQSIGLDWDNEGNLYVSSWGGASIRKFDPDGNDLGLFISSSLQGPTNIWFNENQELIVLNWSGSTAKRFDDEGNFIDDFITGLSNPEGVAIYPNGNILIGNGGNGSVKLFDPNGNFIEDFIAPGTGGLAFPNGVTLREVASVSVNSVPTETNFIQPTIGTVFYLHSFESSAFESLEVYNISGLLVEQQTVNNHQIWNASKYPEGIYIITAKLSSGKVITQKVLVKK